MTDPVATAFSVLNSMLAVAGLVATLYGQYHFKEGLLVKSLRRGTIVGVILILHFSLEALNVLGMIALMPIVNYLLEFAFMLGLAYVTYGFVRDWQTLPLKT